MSLIEAFNANDLDAITDHFTDTSVYHNIPMEAVTGAAAIREALNGFLGMSTAIDWVLVHIAEGEDGAVLTERVDRFEINGKWLELPVMGTFEVSGGKIQAWRDYFDLNQFQSQLA
ncbi:MAG: limonene-1,2-epoxide hydrolase [Gammaproteobacteria bacterium]|nr:MAG: limonene-1,2-epoxide hydrolase [Gammaproteobacteria bacterium]